MKNLKDILEDFNKAVGGDTNEDVLQDWFKKIAEVLLYGGYIQVREDYRVYIRTVEFYFHSEKPSGVHDPIVYHRNLRGCDGIVLAEVPYFPIMTLHSHDSGFDITFESETNEYRASALIRSYEVKGKDGMYLVWNKKSMFVKQSTYMFNTQSLYLRKLLNGFIFEKDTKNNNVYWQDEPLNRPIHITKAKRRNVLLSENEFVYKKIDGQKCKREWSFTREEQV